MKNISNSENRLNLKNICIFNTMDENSFYSLDLNSPNKNLINKKRKRENNPQSIYDKMNKLELNQHKTNDKLDLILSILKIKLLGKNDFKIHHYDLCFIQKNKKEEEKEIEKEYEEADIKEENDLNANDEIEFEHISQIKKGAHFNSNNLNRKNFFNENNFYKNNKNINIISSGNDNLTEMINDFLNQNQNEKNDEQKDKEKIPGNKIENDNGQNNENSNENIDNEKKEEINNIDEENNINNNLMNVSKNKIIKNNIDLNKYKNESEKENKNDMNNKIDKIIDNGINSINEIINKENNNYIYIYILYHKYYI